MIHLTIRRKGGPESGWFAPPRGTHTGEKHRAVGSGKVGGEGVTYEWFDSPVARGLFASNVKRRDRENIAFVLVTTKIPAKHLDELIIRTSAAHGYTLGATGYEKREGGRIVYHSAGFYIPHRGLSEMHIHPYAVRMLSGSIVHEVGHHVWQQYKWRAGEDRTTMLGGRIDNVRRGLEGRSSGDLAKLGLRVHSVADSREFMADAYMVKHHGKSSQWKDLSGFCKGLELDLDEIFEG